MLGDLVLRSFSMLFTLRMPYFAALSFSCEDCVLYCRWFLLSTEYCILIPIFLSELTRSIFALPREDPKSCVLWNWMCDDLGWDCMVGLAVLLFMTLCAARLFISILSSWSDSVRCMLCLTDMCGSLLFSCPFFCIYFGSVFK